MHFDPPLLRGRFLRRYKRFFVDVELDDGRTVIAHCPNTGSLAGCLSEGAEAWLQPAHDPARKLRYTWKLIRISDTLVGVDTGLAVPIVEEAVTLGLLEGLSGHERMTREVSYGREQRSRIDLLLSSGGTPKATKGKQRVLYDGDARVYVEVKNTTLVDGATAMFPDAVTERGQKHLEELMHVVDGGQRAAMVFCVQRADCERFRPADHVDPAYGKLLRRAKAHGVALFALRATADSTGVYAQQTLPVSLD
jgi:sugar fermentation stimulation protein A